MKTFSFFTPKGGCGKTTLTLLFAAYLRYGKGKAVKVIVGVGPLGQLGRLGRIAARAACRTDAP